MNKRNKYWRQYRRVWREANPHEYAYRTLKTNAKRRGHVFTISFSYFLTIPRIEEYIWLKGRRKEDLTMDRIENDKGYEEGNCQVITNEENNRKRWDEERKLREEIISRTPTIDAPF